MSQGYGKVFWMCFAHPRGRLVLRKQNWTIQPSYRAYFDSLTRGELLGIVARSLAAEKRFSHQLTTPVSVLEHSWWLSTFLQEEKPGLMAYADVHDSMEFAGHDRPKMLKSLEDSAFEDAIFEAFEWGVQCPDKAEFNKWDSVAAAAEAELFGQKTWPWLKDYRIRYGDDSVDQYKRHIGKEGYSLSTIKKEWTTRVTEGLAARGLALDHQFKAPQDFLEGIVHD